MRCRISLDERDRQSGRKAFFSALDKKFEKLDPTKIDWQGASSMLSYTESVNHEANMPNFLKSDAAIKQLQSDMLTNATLNIDTRLGDLVKTLQGTFGGS